MDPLLAGYMAKLPYGVRLIDGSRKKIRYATRQFGPIMLFFPFLLGPSVRFDLVRQEQARTSLLIGVLWDFLCRGLFHLSYIFTSSSPL